MSRTRSRNKATPTEKGHASAPSADGLVFESFIDEMTLLGASGWAWVPTSPATSVEIEAVFEGQKLGRTTANILRPDLEAAGKGTGCYGFRLVFDRPFTGHGRPTLRAHSASAHADLFEPAFEVDGVFTTRIGAVEGHVEQLSTTGAKGWAWLPNQPAVSVELTAVLDGRTVGRGVADIMRSDLFSSRRGTGRYGFELAFEEPVSDIERLSVQVLQKDCPISLPILPSGFQNEHKRGSEDNKPHVEVCSRQQMPSVKAHIDSLSRLNAVGWAWAPDMPDLTLQIEAVLDELVIGRALANNMRTDLLRHGIGTGLYGFDIRFLQPLMEDITPRFRVLVPAQELSPGPDLAKLPPLPPSTSRMSPEANLSRLMTDHACFTSQGPEFEEHDPTILSGLSNRSSTDPLIVAFYLPQFHAIPENDSFWGKGFTEWRQLPRSLPRFPGHYQPRIPRDLGFYDPTDPQHLQAQATLAKASGVSAFAFYYYWFNGRRVLERPLDSLLSSKVGMPFMIIWANENWTRTWDGSDSQILLRQDYLHQDEAALLDDWARHFIDCRYLRIGDMPLLCIYNPQAIPDAKDTIRRWREFFQERYGIKPLFFMCQTFGSRDPHQFGLDGAMEFPPHKLAEHVFPRPAVDAYSVDYQGQIFSYDDFVSASLNEANPGYPLIKTSIPGWDNDPRRPNRGFSLEKTSPRKYESWLHNLIKRALDHPINGTPIVAINAWNEWAECAYLEPDVYYGAAYLNATARALRAAVSNPEVTDPVCHRPDYLKLSVVVPNYNHEKYIVERLNSIVQQTWKPDEIILLDDCSSDSSLVLAVAFLEKNQIDFKVIVNEKNSGNVFKQWMNGIQIAKNNLIWIAESDDGADVHFLERLLPVFERQEVLLAFGQVKCIDTNGGIRPDLTGYLDDLKTFSWHQSVSVPAFAAFKHDFSVKNIIPNVSGALFRKPNLRAEEVSRLYEYQFAGDWYFYALISRGGQIAYKRRALSFFRVAETSVSRDAFSSTRHIREHAMILEDLASLYKPEPDAVMNHILALSVHFPNLSLSTLTTKLSRNPIETASRRKLRICIAAHSFAVGGGELIPVELANTLKKMGHHVTYLVMEKDVGGGRGSLRDRLQDGIPVVFWQDVHVAMLQFVAEYGFDILNSHNMSVESRLSAASQDIGIPYIGSLHGGYESSPEHVTPKLMDYVARNVDAWFYLGDKNKEVLVAAGVPESRFVRSFNALPEITINDLDRARFRSTYGIASEAIVFVICSRATEDKGWQVAVDVVRELASQQFDAHLVLIGDGPDAEELRRRNESLPFVTFLGHVDHPSRLLSCFDVGIFPSVFPGETFPLFLLECFRAGLPVISSDIGEIPYMMGFPTDKPPGITVDHRRNHDRMVADMVDAAARIAGNKTTYRNMSKRATKSYQRFSMRALSELYEDIFYRVFEDVDKRQ